MNCCLIYTVKADPCHTNQLRKSLGLVKANLNPFVPNLDILFFCDKAAESVVSDMTRKLGLSNRVKFLEFVTTQPKYGNEIQSRISDQISYKNMCRFWAGEVFKNSDVLEYDYYMRLDCDSFITAPLEFNPFETLAEKDKFYGYLTGGMFLDSPDVCRDLNATLKRFETEHGDSIISPANFKEGSLYYTNFEICRIRSFSESAYMSLYEYLDRSGGIYIYRWGIT